MRTTKENYYTKQLVRVKETQDKKYPEYTIQIFGSNDKTKCLSLTQSQFDLLLKSYEERN